MGQGWSQRYIIAFPTPVNESYILYSSLFSILHDYIFLLPFDDGIWEKGDCDRFVSMKRKPSSVTYLLWLPDVGYRAWLAITRSLTLACD